jgi:hypothetical protein
VIRWKRLVSELSQTEDRAGNAAGNASFPGLQQQIGSRGASYGQRHLTPFQISGKILKFLDSAIPHAG